MARVTLRGTFWSYASYYGGKLLIFITTIIMARLLSKEEIGVAGYALVAISFLDVLSDLGIGPALIYHKDIPGSADTAFWLGLFVSITLFAITWALAPLTGAFFHDERSIAITRALAVTFPITSLSNVHDMLLRKELSFARKFIPDSTKYFVKGSVSILLAVLGFSYWSLIWGQIIGNLAAVVAYWMAYPFRPKFVFSFSMARKLISYGVHIVAGNSLAIVVTDSDYMLIGRYLGSAALGVYSVAFRIPDLLVMQFCMIISRVIFPVFARIRDNSSALAAGFLTTLRYVSLVTLPLGIGMALVARPLVLVVFTEKWIEAVPVIQAIAIYSVVLSLSYNAGDLYKAQGRPNLVTALALLRVTILVPTLIYAATKIGTIQAVGWAHAAVAAGTGIVELVVAGRILKMSLAKIIGAIRPALFSTALMAGVVIGIMALTNSFSQIFQLLVPSMAGAAVYLLTIWAFNREIAMQVRKTLSLALAR